MHFVNYFSFNLSVVLAPIVITLTLVLFQLNDPTEQKSSFMQIIFSPSKQTQNFSINIVKKIVNNTHYLGKENVLQHKRRHITLVWNDTHCATLEGWLHLGKIHFLSYIDIYICV